MPTYPYKPLWEGAQTSWYYYVQTNDLARRFFPPFLFVQKEKRVPRGMSAKLINTRNLLNTHKSKT